MDNILYYTLGVGRVLRDKAIYGIFNFDLHKNVKRVYSKESYYSNLYTTLAQNPDFIIDGIYLGSAFNAVDYNWLKGHNIETIVNVTPSIGNYYPEDFEYHNFTVIDLNEASLNDYYDKFYDLVENRDSVFVHCFAGKSRSAALVLYYMVKKYYWDVDQALEILKVKRPFININSTFLKEIKEKREEISYF